MPSTPSASARQAALALAIGGVLLAPCAQTAPAPPCGTVVAAVPEGWVSVAIGQAFCLSLPPTLRRRPMRSKDSLSGEFESAEMQLMFDYGAYSSPLTEFASLQPQVEAITVDGHEAKLILLPGMTAVHVPAAGARQRLTVIVRYGDPATQPHARRIVQAIRFATTP